MTADRSVTCSRLLTASLALGIAITTAACGSSSHALVATTTSTTRSSVTTAAGPSRSAKRAAVVLCLTSHGMDVPVAATARQIRAAVVALPVAQQQSLFTACASLLPPTLREKLQALIAQEESTTTVAP